MARGKQSRFDVLAANGDPYKIVAFLPIGSRLRPRVMNGATYWMGRPPPKPGVKSTEVYVGSDANKAVLEAAWAVVSAEIIRAEAAADTPEVRRLRELQELAGGPPLARTTADSPLKLASGAGRGGGRRPKR